MTDLEKANEICKRHFFDSNHYDCCMEMAEWKDAQFEKVTRMLFLQLYAYSNEIGSKTVMTIIQQAEELYKS